MNWSDISETVKTWLIESKNDVGDCTINIGHVKHAFQLAFHFLHKQTDYKTAIFNTLLKGGDTDTNAAIVGAMMGAYWSVDGIPESMKNPVLSYDCTKYYGHLGHIRPEIYKPKEHICTMT
jgi:ADP-ribosylglycohydrolase